MACLQGLFALTKRQAVSKILIGSLSPKMRQSVTTTITECLGEIQGKRRQVPIIIIIIIIIIGIFILLSRESDESLYELA